MLGQRLQQANKKGAKRWLRYHEHGISNNPVGFGIGVYRKKKGCECRACSALSQMEKKKRNKQLRREVIVV